MLAQVFFVLLGKMVREVYLPDNSIHWVEIEKQLGIALDFNRYRLIEEEEPYCPAVEIAASLFTAALQGKSYFEVSRVVQEAEPAGSVKININYHSWRRWFYSLWDQSYEWGRITIKKSTAEANGKLYQHIQLPRWNGEDAIIQSRQLLEAHDFKVVIHPGQFVEYWR